MVQFGMTLNDPPNPDFKVTPLFDADYLEISYIVAMECK